MPSELPTYIFPIACLGMHADFKYACKQYGLSWMIARYSIQQHGEICSEGIEDAAGAFNLSVHDEIIEADYNHVKAEVGDRPALTSIHRDVFWEACRENPTFSGRDFRCLLAINSIIGKKAYAKISYDFIRVRANGVIRTIRKPSGELDFSRKVSIFTPKSELDENPLLKPLTEKQVRLAMQRLKERGFFNVVLRANRYRYYSNTLTEEELVKRILEKVNGRKAVVRI
jgi:hypothetical protein